jgi:hypothetical protein
MGKITDSTRGLLIVAGISIALVLALIALESSNDLGLRRKAVPLVRAVTAKAPPGFLPPARSTAGPMSADWEEFAQQVDQACAITYNHSLGLEAQIEAVGTRRGWSNDRIEAMLHYNWARNEAELHRIVSGLGQPPARPALLARWNANVAHRGRLFRDEGDAWMRGEPSRANAIAPRKFALKDEADRLGKRFGLRICTSN